jgi:hypothetical protein
MQPNHETLKPMQPTPCDAGGNPFKVFCSCCNKPVKSDEVLCDLAAPPGTFYCPDCATNTAATPN